ncbi:Oligopeptide ABC transporter, periplasmic oligopeptide-binding protein OppA (TC 3.A.1.5.1) [hydrothermal vent metagenome]|uniref:Oligopeptide ABC transporter, periplasmic oligopeptide-binding protein OppA (TC 3.A.1.5.1) n=1 Tax=hydrothermal vent metagenome TaxID=652676 RepID=A0A3B0WBZ9_9ZZZZ
MKLYFSIIFWLLLLNTSEVYAQTTLNRGNGSEPDSLNIHLAEGLNSHNILRDLYEGLMTSDVQGKPIYGAAISHNVEYNVWTFKLRENGKWSDGSNVVAADFVRGWQRAINPETAAPYAFLLNNIVHAKKITNIKLTPNNLAVKAIDDYTLEVRLWQMDSAFLEKLTLPIFYPVAKNTSSQIISNGAYKLTDWRIQEKIVLEKNPYYYATEKIYFDKVNYWVTEDQSSELKRFRAGELDITESIPDSQIDWIKQNLPQQLRIYPYLGSFFLGLNMHDEHLNNPKLRQALSLSIDRKILTEKVLKTGQQPAYGIVPAALLNTKPTKPVINQAQRLLQAKKLFQQSGIDITELNIEILYNNSENQRKVAIAIAAMWKQTLGIKTTLLNQEWKVFVQSRKSNKRQAFRSGWIADYADALSFLELFKSNSRFNFYRYKNSEYDEIIENIGKTADLELKNQLIERAESILLHDMPVIPLYYYVSRHMVSGQLRGFKDNVADRHLSKYLYKED